MVSRQPLFQNTVVISVVLNWNIVVNPVSYFMKVLYVDCVSITIKDDIISFRCYVWGHVGSINYTNVSVLLTSDLHSLQ